MSLPNAFSTSENYFEYCLNFFNKYKFLITHPNTHVLTDELLDNIPTGDYLKAVNLQDKEFKLENLRGQSEFVDDFLNDLQKIRVKYESVEDVGSLVTFEAPVCPKKKYEVEKLSEEIVKLCNSHDCDTVIDVGSGLGYLDQRLDLMAGFNVLGLECNAGHCTSAIQRQKQYYADSVEKVVYYQLRVSENSAEDISRSLKNNFKTHGPVCLVGLHSCADLSVDGINLFLKMAEVKTLILMPCCYHRLQHHESGFTNFPLSDVLKRQYDETSLKLGVPFLRLAAHPTVNTSGLEDMVFSLLARAVLQEFANKHDLVIKRSRRKAIKQTSTKDRFGQYLQQLSTGYTLLPDPEKEPRPRDDLSFDYSQLWQMWSDLDHLIFKKTAVYITLQNWLQPVVENFLLYDRLVYLNENGVMNCWHEKFFNESQSPRCIALLAVKNPDKHDRDQNT